MSFGSGPLYHHHLNQVSKNCYEVTILKVEQEMRCDLQDELDPPRGQERVWREEAEGPTKTALNYCEMKSTGNMEKETEQRHWW